MCILSAPWREYREHFLKWLRDASDLHEPEGFQLVTVPYPVYWNQPQYGQWLLKQQFANNIPLWGSTYSPSVGCRVTDAYFQFLFNIDAGDVAEVDGHNQLNSVRAALREELIRQQQIHEEGTLAWQSASSLLPRFVAADFERWSMTSAHDERLRRSAQRVASLTADLLQRARRAGTSSLVLAQAIERFTNPEYQEELVDDNGYRSKYPIWQGNPDLGEFIASAEAGNARVLDFTWESSAVPSTTTTGGAGWVDVKAAPASLINGGFLRVGGQSGAGDPRIGVTHNGAATGYTIRIKAKGIVGITLEPGRWFFGRVIARFKDGPFLASGPYGSARAKFWGQGGTFPYRPTRAYLAYKPSITVTLGANDLAIAQDAARRGETIGVGPFEFSPSDTISFDGNSFQLNSSLSEAMLVAVSNVVMPGGALVDA